VVRLGVIDGVIVALFVAMVASAVFVVAARRRLKLGERPLWVRLLIFVVVGWTLTSLVGIVVRVVVSVLERKMATGLAYDVPSLVVSLFVWWRLWVALVSQGSFWPTSTKRRSE
jgi:hypothetical protein